MITIEFINDEKALSKALQIAERECPGCTTSDLFNREIEKTSRGTLRLKISIKER